MFIRARVQLTLPPPIQRNILLHKKHKWRFLNNQDGGKLADLFVRRKMMFTVPLLWEKNVRFFSRDFKNFEYGKRSIMVSAFSLYQQSLLFALLWGFFIFLHYFIIKQQRFPFFFSRESNKAKIVKPKSLWNFPEFYKVDHYFFGIIEKNQSVEKLKKKKISSRSYLDVFLFCSVGNMLFS